MKRKKGIALPRLTVLAMSRKELTAFVTSVEFMRSQVNNLAEEVGRLRDLVDRLTLHRQPKKAAAVELPHQVEENGQEVNHA